MEPITGKKSLFNCLAPIREGRSPNGILGDTDWIRVDFANSGPWHKRLKTRLPKRSMMHQARGDHLTLRRRPMESAVSQGQEMCVEHILTSICIRYLFQLKDLTTLSSPCHAWCIGFHDSLGSFKHTRWYYQTPKRKLKLILVSKAIKINRPRPNMG